MMPSPFLFLFAQLLKGEGDEVVVDFHPYPS
jgi:hypothetical protein